jgi:hypothetical protein
MALNAETIAVAIPSMREQIAAMDCSFLSKSGKKTWGLDSFYNGSAGKSETGLEISVISIVDIDASQAYTLSVQQTPYSDRVLAETNQSASAHLVSERVNRGSNLKRDTCLL